MPLRRILVLGLLAASLPLAALAEAEPTRTITLRWRHSGGAEGFRLYVRRYQESYGEGTDVGLPEPVDGVYAHDLAVTDREAVWAVVRAYAEGGALLSAPSNEEVYLLPE